MTAYPTTPWHRRSFDRFLNEGLPQLLAEHLPLGGYRVEPLRATACRVQLTLAAASGEVTASYELPLPDEDGVFEVEGRAFVVLPTASTDELDTAEIRCAGEQLTAHLAARLGLAPADLDWDTTRLRTWLPLEEWVREFLHSSQPLDTTNRLARLVQLRRLMLPENRRMFTRGHCGRACPIETPEGPNIGRLLTIARGAEIREGRLVIVDDRPEAGLGLAASAIPFLEHCDTARLIMGANMMRQWLTPPDPEPALVQTGNEPETPDFWCGRNLLTAYISGGWESYDDSIVVSESCARRFSYPRPLQPGDKLSNRYGNKGVVSRILPDAQMPRLPDGTPVELVFSPMNLYSRLTFGQLREAVLGLAARQDGKPARVPPFHAPKAEELRARLVDAGLPESGMHTLQDGRTGCPMTCPSTVGYVYWGKLHHLAHDKIHATVTPVRCQRQGEAERHALQLAGAFETIREQYHTRSAERTDAGELATQVTAGPVGQAPPPSPRFAELQRRLAVAGIQATLEGEQVMFRRAAVPGEALTLALPIPNPWHPETPLREVGVFPESPAYAGVVEANTRLARMTAHQAPESLTRKATADLEAKVQAFFATLLPRKTLQFHTRVMFSGWAVIVVGGDLHHDQVGLPEEMAWTLFGPLLTRTLGDAEAVRARTDAAAEALDTLMAQSWVIINRAPTVSSTGLLAFHPIRHPGQVLRIHPFVCNLMNADFDGDQLAVFLPITEAGQREAGEKLTIAAHLERDPSLIPLTLPFHDARFGLAWLARTPEGMAEIERLVSAPITLDNGTLNTRTLRALQAELVRQVGVAGMLDAIERLIRRGFEVAQTTGASISPFLRLDVEPPARPGTDDPDAWNAYVEEYTARVLIHYANPMTNADPTALVHKSGARGSLRLLLKAVGIQGVVSDLNGGLFPITHGYVEGLTPEEVVKNCIGTREAVARGWDSWSAVQREMFASAAEGGYSVLARAMRAKRPGIVFARAAAAEETDPLSGPLLRLYVGLPA